MITVTNSEVFLHVREQEEGQMPHRRVVMPGSLIGGEWTATDISAEPAEVQELAGEVWTTQAVSAFRSQLEAAILPPNNNDLYNERERRIALPLTILGLSVGTIAINMDGESQRNLGGLGQIGMLRKMTASTETTEFKAYDNQLYDLSPDDLILMGVQVAARIQACYRAEWALKGMSPIPSDYADDGYWP